MTRTIVTLLACATLAAIVPDAEAQRRNESCNPVGICVFEREIRAGQIDFFVENRTEREIAVEISFTDLYNWRSSRRLPYTKTYKAGRTQRALRLTKPSPQETSRKRWRWKWRYIFEKQSNCGENGSCVELEMDDDELVYSFVNGTSQDLEVELTLMGEANLVKPDGPIIVACPPSEKTELARVRVRDIWSSYDRGYRIDTRPLN
ncbi:MAG: hypothetical protein HKN29_09810 [Rhodothermales bacterium]|nr:hypothetical protein [Rhodothermales bacterium]